MRKLINTRDFTYNKNRVDAQDAILNSLKESMNEEEMVHNAWLEGLDVIKEDVEANLKNEALDEAKKEAMLKEEVISRMNELSRKIFSEIVLEAIPLSDDTKKAKADEILTFSGDVFDGLLESEGFNVVKGGAWDILMDAIIKESYATDKQIHDCYVDIVNEEVNVLLPVVNCVADKVERAVKMEQTATNLKEEKAYIPDTPSLFRCLVESAYKEITEEVEDKAGEALVEAAISYAVLETINTMKMVDNLDYDYVNQNYKYLKR